MGTQIINAVVIVAGLLLEQAPKAVLLPEERLADYYEPALQNFKDLMAADYRLVFEPDNPREFRQLVMDHVRRYLDYRRQVMGL